MLGFRYRLSAMQDTLLRRLDDIASKHPGLSLNARSVLSVKARPGLTNQADAALLGLVLSMLKQRPLLLDHVSESANSFLLVSRAVRSIIHFTHFPTN
jgi:hypothetical protein